jgi:hypothetical protein
VISLFLKSIVSAHVPIGNGLRLQVLSSTAGLPRCQKHQFAAFIKDKSILVVWDDDPKLVLERAERIQKSLMQMIWHKKEHFEASENTSGSSPVNSGPLSDSGHDDAGPLDLESAARAEKRGVPLTSPVMVGATFILSFGIVGLGWRALALEIKIDGSFFRLFLVLLFPMQFFLSLVRQVTNSFQRF